MRALSLLFGFLFFVLPVLLHGQDRTENSLSSSGSPYLRAHAADSVAWLEWGPEAFERALQLHRPIFVSVGFSACHWCHVMARESFRDPEVAAYLNQHYVSILVDRESRPDIDTLLIGKVVDSGGSAGWPLNVWLDPTGEFVFGTSYLPKNDGERGFETGFLTLLKRFQRANPGDPSSPEENPIVNSFQGSVDFSLQDLTRVREAVVDTLGSRYDRLFGGLRVVPKFPRVFPIPLLLRYLSLDETPELEDWITKTLFSLRMGGIFDQVGFGFHRYAQDLAWRVPHFEKMLSDNALLAGWYVEAWKKFREPVFRQTAEEILHFLASELGTPEGAFSSSLSSESLDNSGASREGIYYTWDQRELDLLFPKQEREILNRVLTLDSRAVFEGRWLPFLAHRSQFENPPEREGIFQKLRSARSVRLPPERDRKILCGWNGLALSAFAKAGGAFGSLEYLASASKLANFLLATAWKDGSLQRIVVNQADDQPEFLEDYAYLIAGLLDLFEVDPDPKWLKAAIELDRSVSRLFEDRERGGFYESSESVMPRGSREKSLKDSELPAPGAIHARNLLRLGALTDLQEYRERFKRWKTSVNGATISPQELTRYIETFLTLEGETTIGDQVILILSGTDEKGELARMVAEAFLPERIVLNVPKESLPKLIPLMPWLKGKEVRNGESTAYVCRHYRCSLPVTTGGGLKRALAGLVEGVSAK
ncbi:MAG: thioredoxin domain-containing protein [Bdellovibrionales bacterium]|nr:thioredoxin domain-containing protein [Bdellovibrionales bacterium]